MPAVTARLVSNPLDLGVPVSDKPCIHVAVLRVLLNMKNIVLHTKGDSMSNYCYITGALAGILALYEGGRSWRSL